MDGAFKVVSADVITVTPRVVTLRPTAGPRVGETISAPRTIFQDPALVESGDDEISIAAWFAEREKLTGGG
jgi:hypothetical protein